MALIKCPECSGNVSTSAATCPHCGFPIASTTTSENICMIFNDPYDMTDVLNIVKQIEERGDEHWFRAHDVIYEKREKGLGVKELRAQDFIDMDRIFEKMEKTGKVPPEYPFPDTPRCPTCGSTDIRKLSAATRGVSLGLFGLASKTARSQFVCENCGYKW